MVKEKIFNGFFEVLFASVEKNNKTTAIVLCFNIYIGV